VAVQQSKFVAASSAAKLRTRQEEELKAMVAEQERQISESEKLHALVSIRWKRMQGTYNSPGEGAACWLHIPHMRLAAHSKAVWLLLLTDKQPAQPVCGPDCHGPPSSHGDDRPHAAAVQ
jgi:hypothetical protein